MNNYHHVTLLGDSIFDNAIYVPGEPSVSDQLKEKLLEENENSEVFLLAHDGDIVSDTLPLVYQIPRTTTHLVLSVGGNNALQTIPLLNNQVQTIGEAMSELCKIQTGFQNSYRKLLTEMQKYKLPMAVCTVYDDVPGLDNHLKTALSLFNDVIVREANRVRAKIFDLRLICDEHDDYSVVSPIEPSAKGGLKITSEISEWVFSSFVSTLKY